MPLADSDLFEDMPATSSTKDSDLFEDVPDEAPHIRGSEIERRIENDPTYLPTLGETRAIRADRESLSYPQRAAKLATGVVSGIGGVLGNLKDQAVGTYEGVKDPDHEYSPFRTLAEGAGRGIQHFSGLITKAGRHAGDIVPDAIHRTSDEDYHTRFLKDLQEQRLLQAMDEGKNPAIPYIDQSKVLQPMANLTGTVWQPPVALPAALASRAASLGGKAAVAAAKTGTGQALSKVASAAERGSGWAKKALNAPLDYVSNKFLKGAQYGLKGVVRSAPTAPALVGMGIAGAAAHAAGIPVAQTIIGTQIGRGAAAGAETAAKAIKDVAQTEGTSQIGRLAQVSKNPNAQPWLRKLAKVASTAGGDTALDIGEKVGTGALQGAKVGGALGVLSSSDNPEELGQAIGSGAALGGATGAALYPALKNQRFLQNHAADASRFFEGQLERGAPPEVIAKMSPKDAANLYAINHAFENQLNIEIHGKDGYAATATMPDSAAEYHPETKTLLVNGEAGRNIADLLYHESFHALWDANPGNKTLIVPALDQAIGGPEMLPKFKAIYAARMAGLDEAKITGQRQVDPGDFKKIRDRVQAMDEQSTQTHNDPNDWIYREIWSEIGPSALRKVNVATEVLKSPSLVAAGLARGADFLSKFGVTFKEKKVGDRTHLFPDFSQAAESPELHKLAYSLLRDRNSFVNGITTQKVPEIPITKDMVGKHAGLPVSPQPDGTMGNAFATVVNPDPAIPEGAKVVFKTKRQVKQETAARDAQIAATVAREPEIIAPQKPQVATMADPQDAGLVTKRLTPSGLTETMGTKLGQWFYTHAYVPESVKTQARALESAIQGGDVVNFWAGTEGTGRGAAYTKSKTDRANAPQYQPSGPKNPLFHLTNRDGAPFSFTVEPSGAITVDFLDLTSATKKAQKWATEGKLHEWDGNVDTFNTDLHTYLKNLGEGVPGETTIGVDKKRTINAFMLGALGASNPSILAKNPLRAAIKDRDDKGGIIRSFRLDRINAVKPTGETVQFNYRRAANNLSPDFGFFKAPQTIPVEGPQPELPAFDNGEASQ